jgi:hypothetical protein
MVGDLERTGPTNHFRGISCAYGEHILEANTVFLTAKGFEKASISEREYTAWCAEMTPNNTTVSAAAACM